jgi:ligand-binding sensor domain-containing protein
MSLISSGIPLWTPRGGKPGLIKYNTANKDFKSVSVFADVIPKTMVMDKKGTLWVGTGEGLIEFRNDSVISTVTQDDGLLSNNINLLAAGDDGSIYVGTNNGLNRYFPESKRILKGMVSPVSRPKPMLFIKPAKESCGLVLQMELQNLILRKLQQKS